MPEDETLSKAELALIDKIVGALGMRSFQKLLWDKVEQAFRFTFHNTQVKYGFTHATPDPLALKYLEERVFILSDKTRDRLTGNLRWGLLEGIRNTESISDIKKRLAPIFTKMHDYELERIARTETLNAMNAGRLEAYEVSEVTHYKMWRAAINNKRTAADSKRLHGQIQELGDPFVDPKTGDAVMHPPNRPNCRCAMIPLRKLPESIVHKGGQMYAADEMVGKIEIDIGSLQKGEKRVWVKPTSKRKGHYRKVKGAKKVEVATLRDGINNMNFIAKDDKSIDNILKSGEWDLEESTYFRSAPPCRNVLIHAEKGKIYAMSKLFPIGRSVHISLLEINPDMRRKGYGVKVMRDIISTLIDSEIYDEIDLTSVDSESNKFYDAIGMIIKNPEEKEIYGDGYQARYGGDKEWMKKFMKSISKKQ